MREGVSRLLLLALSVVFPFDVGAQIPLWRFHEDTAAAGIGYVHGSVHPQAGLDEQRRIAGGVAAGDYDSDGFIDLYAVTGDMDGNRLFRNRGDGTFEERALAAGVELPGATSSGPVFADIDGDGQLDLFVGGVGGTPVSVFRNRGDGTFEDVSALTGFATHKDVFGAAFGDFDRDNDLDVVLSHWAEPIVSGESPQTLWRNEGGFGFTDISLSSRVAEIISLGGVAQHDFSFTPNFADIDADGWPDLLIASDFGQSRVLRNAGDGTFTDHTDPAVISDENGMGAAVGDYDNDGILDWFVSSIWDPSGSPNGHWGVSGNRLYRGLGDGSFEDVTDIAGVRAGYWGWGATFADLNNDGYLDLFHTNGFGIDADPLTEGFFDDPLRLFVSNRDGTFTEQSDALSVLDTGLGRGVVAFDQERDGDLDLLVSNNFGPARFFRNVLETGASFLSVRLRGLPPNTRAIGARLYLTTHAGTQVRELRAGSNFQSQDPAEAHFGLDGAATAPLLRVLWPRGGLTEWTDVAARQVLELTQPAALCGNAVVENRPVYGEQCDDGVANGTPDSLCQVNCLFKPRPDLCDWPKPLAHPRLRMSGSENFETTELRFQGRVDPRDAEDADPLVQGVSVRVDTGARSPVLLLEFPPGGWDVATRRGWRVDASGVGFRYRDDTSMVRLDRDAVGGLWIRVSTKVAGVPVGEAGGPLRWSLAFALASGDGPRCFAASFAATDCAVPTPGRGLQCR